MPSPTARYLVVGTCLLCAAWSLYTHTKTQQCISSRGTSVDVSWHGSCSDANATILYAVSERVHRVTNSHRVRGTQCGERIRMHWDGSIHQLVDAGRAPAVTTGKRHIRVCLDDAHATNDVDAVVFIVLHELAHIGSGSIGHTDEFWRTFQFLLQVAEKEGVYVAHNPNATVCGERLGDMPSGL